MAPFLIVAVFLLSTSRAHAQGFALTKAIDSTTLIPGTGVTYNSAFDVAISGDTIVFFGRDATFTNLGIYRSSLTGTVNLVANRSNSVPGGVGAFTALQCPNISGDNFVFQGRDSNPVDTGVSVISKFGASPLAVVANQATAIPNGSGSFSSLGLCPSIDGASVAFYGAQIPAFGDASDRQEGVYYRPGVGLPIERIADKSTARPGLGGTFNNALSGIGNFTNPIIKGDDIVFRGGGNEGTAAVGIYHFDGSSDQLTALVDSSDVMPGAVGNFTFFQRLDFDGQRIAFIAQQGDFPATFAGVYVLDVTTDVLSTVATLNTTIPGTATTFSLNNGFTNVLLSRLPCLVN
jgi:hypothetical protein